MGALRARSAGSSDCQNACPASVVGTSDAGERHGRAGPAHGVSSSSPPATCTAPLSWTSVRVSVGSVPLERFAAAAPTRSVTGFAARHQTVRIRDGVGAARHEDRARAWRGRAVRTGVMVCSYPVRIANTCTEFAYSGAGWVRR